MKQTGHIKEEEKKADLKLETTECTESKQRNQGRYTGRNKEV